ncbi:MAG: LON peptidase substrate-binding domain-containing protein [Flavobacteriales bacterium]|nr:LON peptidase substrate-binding domain-containing protein [Flavobacteriales bacterium]
MDNLKTIPLFPLTILPLPGEHVALHIFEQRYQDLIAHLENTQTEFGIPFVREKQNLKYGVSLQLERVLTRYSGGESDVEVRATSFFKLHSFQMQGDGVTYPSGEIESLEEINIISLRDELLAEWNSFSQMFVDKVNQNDTRLLHLLHTLDLSPEERFRFLKCYDHGKHQEWLMQKMRMKRVIQTQTDSIKKGYSLN